MPRFQRMSPAVPPEIHPETGSRPVAVSDGGDVLLAPTRRRTDTLLALMDSSGTLVSRLGRHGAGPGELRDAYDLRFQGSMPLVTDLDQARVLVFRRSGRVAEESNVPPGYRPLAVLADSVDWMRRTAGGLPELVRRSINGADERVLLAAGDSFLVRATAGNRAAGLDIPAYATTVGREALGDGATYELEYRGPDGRLLARFGRELTRRRRTPHELAEARARLEQLRRRGFRGPNGMQALPGIDARLDTLERETLPHFGRRGIWFDGAGRLWVIGESNDSTFADAFADTTFLGRVMIPCRHPGNGISLRGHWLVLVCSSDDPSREGAELQRYRLTDS